MREKYTAKWMSYISGLNGLNWNLEKDDRKKLNNLMDELKKLALRAAENEKVN